ncbi:short chain dehydrogenase reductase [Corynascus similis CBS 632.67]
MASVLITGSSRGLGLAFVQELASRPASSIAKIFATARGDSPVLDKLSKEFPDRVIPVQLDVTNQVSIKKAASEVEAKLEGKGLDVLINNAAVCYYSPGLVETMEKLEESFLVNVMGVHWVTREFLSLLQKGTLKKVANITSTFGSITEARFSAAALCPAYKVSKSAVNSLTVQYAIDHEKEGFSFIALCPGWIKTELGGGDHADLTPEQAAKASLEIVFTEGQVYNGKLPIVSVEGFEKPREGSWLVYDGRICEW